MGGVIKRCDLPWPSLPIGHRKGREFCFSFSVANMFQVNHSNGLRSVVSLDKTIADSILLFAMSV